MRRVRSKDTAPEILVRQIVHAMGYRYGLHCKYLPGCPDLVLKARKKVIFVHGCFWHRHDCECATLPKSNQGYWKRKQDRNADRDVQNARILRKSGWKVLIIWECETKQVSKLQRRLRRFLMTE